jgi:hypothetical protein
MNPQIILKGLKLNHPS